MTETYDGIILGAGHNALVLQAYLGKAGLTTLCLERRSEIGGGLVTSEIPVGSGFLHNTHSFFHRGITSMPWYDELKLAQFGAEYRQPDLNVAMLLDDGRSLEWWTNIDRTLASAAEFSANDARTLKRWYDDFQPIIRHIVIPESQSTPEEPGERIRRLNKTAEGRLLLKVSAMSPIEFVTTEFESPIVRAGLLFFNGLREVDPTVRGFGHHIPSLIADTAKAQMCTGGSANLARSLAAAARSYGGEIRTGVEPRQILVEDGRISGVETTAGDFITARYFVASSLNPIQTFIDLFDGGVLPPEVRARAASFKFNLIAPLFSLNLNLSEAPHYKNADARPEVAQALMHIIGLEDVQQYDGILLHHRNGTIPPTVMWGSTPTVFDPSQAPSGCHTAFMWEKLPFELRGDSLNWDAEKDKHGHEMLELWTRYAPNLCDAVLESSVRSPLDIQRTFPNMHHGDLLVGAFTNGQIGFNRPFEGAGQYRGIIPGLYLCGSSSHPGGNITGLPGHNCARVLLEDLGLSAA